MGALGSKLRTLEGGGLMFCCPGCGEPHAVWVGDGPGPRWGWNGSGDAPTFTPSILVGGKQTVKDDAGKWTGEWVRGPNGEPLDRCCHSFITDGRIQFLGDCTHALAGQTVDLPNWAEGA